MSPGKIFHQKSSPNVNHPYPGPRKLSHFFHNTHTNKWSYTYHVPIPSHTYLHQQADTHPKFGKFIIRILAPTLHREGKSKPSSWVNFSNISFHQNDLVWLIMILHTHLIRSCIHTWCTLAKTVSDRKFFLENTFFLFWAW